MSTSGSAIKSAKIKAIVPPNEIPPCQSVAASGMFPTEQTKLMKAITGPMITFWMVVIIPLPDRNSALQNDAGTSLAASPATTNPIINS